MSLRWTSASVLLAVLLLSQRASAQESDRTKGRFRERIGLYNDAAELYEAFARAQPKDVEAPSALLDAAVLRLSLDIVDKATQNVELFVKLYGETHPEQAAQALFAVCVHLEEHGDYKRARTPLEILLRRYGARASVDLQITAHALLGRIFVKLKEAKNAEREYEAVRVLWKDPGSVVRTIVTEDPSEKRLAKALTAQGEALFFFAEQKRADADKIRFPEYKGSGKREEVLKHVRTKVTAWNLQKRAAIEAAQKEYLKIAAIQPAPPPRWVVAAASRVGQMWGNFTTEFRAAPIPKEWKGQGVVPGTTIPYRELRREYDQTMDSALEPQKQMAKSAFKTCLDYSAKFQFFDDYSKTCERWLVDNYPHEYLLTEELLPAWGGVGAPLTRLPAEPARGSSEKTP